MLPILFRSTDAGAPVLNNAAGALISVLDACLVTGFNSVGVSSISITSNVATVTTSAAHGLAVGQVAAVADSGVVAANGNLTVLTVPSATTYTAACATADTTNSASGASSKRASLGWVKQFTGTNKAIYKMSDVASYGQQLRIDDTAVGFDARVIGVENPTAIDTYTDAFPTAAQLSGGGYWPKAANTTAAKVWAIVGDERFFYYVTEDSARNGAYSVSRVGHAGGFFGDILSFKNGEAYGCIVGGSYSTGNIITSLPAVKHTSLGAVPSLVDFSYICRQHTGITKSVNVAFNHPGANINAVTSGLAAPNYPSPVDNGALFAEPSLVVENLTAQNHPVRGVIPGLAHMLCRYTDLPNVLGGDVMTATDGTNAKFIVFKGVNSSQAGDSALTLKLSSAWR
jgi:hypothetical protein